jgi:hypothetical protein
MLKNQNRVGVNMSKKSNLMNLECCKNLESLNEEESKICNGGSVLTMIVKKLLPPVIILIPDPDDGGRL